MEFTLFWLYTRGKALRGIALICKAEIEPHQFSSATTHSIQNWVEQRGLRALSEYGLSRFASELPEALARSMLEDAALAPRLFAWITSREISVPNKQIGAVLLSLIKPLNPL